MALRNNTWKLNQWYDQDVAGNVSYTGQQQLWAWGYNQYGNLGLNEGPGNNKSSPVQITGGGDNWSTTFRNYTISSSNALHVKTDGTLWAFGRNTYGQLGQNNRSNYSSPTQVGSDTTWRSLSVSGEYVSATKTDGTLWTWGRQYNGSLGQNNQTHYSSPVQVGSDTTWSENISGGSNNVFAIKTDGTLWSWGFHSYGGLGQNQGTVNLSSPTQIHGGGSDWSMCSGGNNRAGGVKTDGTLWVWGYNAGGSLGQNQTGAPSSKSSPVQIPGTNWGLLSVGSETMMATKTDGTLWTWGSNNNGSLGLNQAPDSPERLSSPAQIPGTNWSTSIGSLSRTYNMGFAMKTDGSLWGWGSGSSGTLSQNNRTNYSSPVQIPGNWGGFSIVNGSGIMATRII